MTKFVILVHLFLFASIFQDVFTIPLDETIPYDEGKHHYWFWVLNISLTIIGICSNSFSLYLFASVSDRSKINLFVPILSLNITDFFLALFRLTRTSMDMSVNGLYGGEIGCITDSFFNFLFGISSPYILALISFITKEELLSGHKISDKAILIYICFIFVFIGIVSFVLILGSLFPVNFGRAQPVTSGNWCFPNLNTLPTATTGYTIAVFIPASFMVYNLYQVRKSILKSQEVLKSTGINSQAKGKYINMVLSLFYFVVLYTTCIFPIMLSSVYEWSTGQYFSPIATSISGLIGIIPAMLVNPVLFIVLNYDMQIVMNEKFGPLFSRIKRMFKKNTVSPLYEFKEDYNSWETWICNETLLKVFKEYASSQFAVESILFIVDVEKYKKECRKFKEEFKQNNDSNTNADIFNENFQLQIKIIHSLANSIYSIYIRLPDAPLEINISDQTRQRIEKYVTKHASITPFIDITGAFTTQNRNNSLLNELAENFDSLFDESQEVIGKIIETDIFPRFRKSQLFRKAVFNDSTGNDFDIEKNKKPMLEN